MRTAVLLSTLSLLGAADAAKVRGLLQKSDIPSSGKEWVSLENGVEFQAGESADPRMEHVRELWSWKNDKEEQLPFVDGTETYYDEYAQAWRLLGFYMDCDHCGGEDNYNKAYCLQQDENGEQQACQRFLLWAAYVDLEYEGNEIAEYMYYDRQDEKWIDAACQENDSDRCVKMDCHEPDTHFSLLGLFKEPNYGEWMEQLFKHQGDCVWTDDEYKLMQANRDAWPQECSQVDDDNENLYYDTKPSAGGRMEIGLYTDAECMTEYTGDTTTADVIDAFYEDYDDDDNNYNGGNYNGLSYDEELEAWNNAFDAFKICQPCKASNLVSIIAADAVVNATGDRYEFRNYDQGDNDADTGFVCHDDAGYEDVNQCMKFRTKTKMLTASYKDLVLAESQGSVTGLNIGEVRFNGVTQTKQKSKERKYSIVHIILSILLLLGSLGFLNYALRQFVRAKRAASGMKAPLLSNSRRRRSRSRSIESRSTKASF